MLQHMQLFHKPDNPKLINDTQKLDVTCMRTYLMNKINLLEAFLEESELPFFGMIERNPIFMGQSATSVL